MGLTCPGCGNDDKQSKVIESRRNQIGRRRRRECQGCGARYTTTEVRSEELRWQVDEALKVLRDVKRAL